jgi:hypothetical protein
MTTKTGLRAIKHASFAFFVIIRLLPVKGKEKNDELLFTTRSSCHCEPVTDVTGVAIPKVLGVLFATFSA